MRTSKEPQDTVEVEKLIEDALERLRIDKNANAAFWRLIDAAGLLKSDGYVNTNAIGTKNCLTGRGFYLGESEV